MANDLKNYSCSQAILYSALRCGWKSARTHLPAFTAFAASYNDSLINEQLAAVDDAEKMQTEEQLQAAINLARVELELSKKELFGAFQLLKRYIALAFTAPYRQINLVEAGSKYYSKAVAQNSDALSNLIQASGDYIVEHKAELTAGNKMPLSFANEYLNKVKAVNDYRNKWHNLIAKKPSTLSEKTKANNKLYTSLMEMFSVGRQLFSKSPIQNEFTFSHVVRLQKGSSDIAGIRAHFTNAVTGANLQGVILTSADGKCTGVTGKDGRLHIKQLPAGTYYFTVEMVGFAPVTRPVLIKPGVTRNFSLSLTPASLLKAA